MARVIGKFDPQRNLTWWAWEPEPKRFRPKQKRVPYGLHRRAARWFLGRLRAGRLLRLRLRLSTIERTDFRA